MPQRRPRLASSPLLVLTLLAGCYPDSDKIRNSGGPGGIAEPDGMGGMGGGGDAGPLLPPNATADNCNDFSVAWCEKSRQCQTGDDENLGGSLCAARMKLWCDRLLGTPVDTSWNASTFKSCITSWSVMSCDEWRDFDLEILKGPGCFVPGKRAEGADCWTFSQCGSLECVGTTACGKCAPRAPLNGACEGDSDCQRPFVCAQKKCALAGGPGAACDDARPCRRSLLCRGGACGPKVAEGQPCEEHEECASGLLCNFAKHACGRASASPTRCSSNEEDGTVLYCGGGGNCDMNMCTPPAGDGQMCSATGTPDCLWPANCVSSRCVLPTPRDCPVGGGPDAGAGPDGAVAAGGPNNTAELTGPMLGTGTMANPALTKALTVKVTAPNSKFEVGSGYALGPGKAASWVVPVKSLSADFDCGLIATNVVLRDAGGAMLATSDILAVSGSVGVTTTGWSKGCLQNGETGYIFGIHTSDTVDLFAGVASVDLSVTTTRTGTSPPARVTPLSYAATGTGFSAKVRNDGSSAVSISKDGFSLYLLLDDAGNPLNWGFIDIVTPEGMLAPGATAELGRVNLFFPGQATKMRLIVDFRSP